MMKKIEKVLGDRGYTYKSFESVKFVNGVKLKESLEVEDLYIEIINNESIIIWNSNGEYLIEIRKKPFYGMMFDLGYILATY